MKRKFRVVQPSDVGGMSPEEAIRVVHGVDVHADSGFRGERPGLPNECMNIPFGSYLGPDLDPPHQPRVAIYQLETLDVEEVHVDRPPITGEFLVEVEP